MNLVVYRTNIGFSFLIIFVLSFTVVLFMEILLISTQNNPFFTNKNQASLTHKINSGQILYTSTEKYSTKLSDIPNNSFSSFTSKLNNFNLTVFDAVWQNVIGTRFKFYVYSAYLDTRAAGIRFIRVIGIAKTRYPEKVKCYIRFKNNSVIVSAINQVIRENWTLKYSALFILCPLNPNTIGYGNPVSVSIVANSSHPLSNHLKILNVHLSENYTPSPNSKNKLYTMAVCVKPFHFNYDRNIQLMEFIEMNRILGVSQFTFYNNTIGPTVDCLLQNYISEGVVEVLPWHGLDIKSQVEIRTEGMFAAMNDCLYRNMYKFEYVIFIDLDEIIVPRFLRTLKDLAKWLEKHAENNLVSGYSFQNAFFYLQWDDDLRVKKLPQTLEKHLTILKKTRRLTKLHPHKQRSKYMCKPTGVIEVGNHFIWQFMPTQVMLNVPSNVAILHHYRICEFGGNDCVKANSTFDRTVHRYWNALIDNIALKWIPLLHKCKLPSIQVA